MIDKISYKKIYDISVILGDQSIIFQGKNLFSSEQKETQIHEETFRISSVAMSVHAGTHLDAPAHLKDYSKTLDNYPLEHFIIPAIVINIDSEKAINVSELEKHRIDKGDALLFRTHNSLTGITINPEPADQYVYMSLEAADFCVQKA